MFIGHYALAFGAKRYAPAVSLGTLFLACQFADLPYGLACSRMSPTAVARLKPFQYVCVAKGLPSRSIA